VTREEEGKERERDLSSFVFDFAFIDKIAFIAHKKFVNIFTSITIDLLKPFLDVVETFNVGDIVHDNDSVGTAIVTTRDSSESLLACSVPDLIGGRSATKI
jgi:hypothetical protein